MTRLAIRLEGDAKNPLIVLGPALGTSMGLWEPICRDLRADFRILRYDHWGHGSSPARLGPLTIDGLVRDLLAAVDDVSTEALAYCGISLGGSIGLALAAAEPERVSSLVVMSTLPHLPPADAWEDRARRVEGAGSVSPMATGLLARWLTDDYAAANPDIAASLASDLAGIHAENYASYCRMAAGLDLRSALPKIVIPTLVISGEDDIPTPTEAQGVMRASLPAGRQIVVPGAHLAVLEHPAVVAGLIRDHVLGDRRR